MSTPFEKSVIHAVKVALTILGSIFVYGATLYFSNPANLSTFADYFNNFGIPVTVINVVVAAILKYMSEHSKPIPVDVSNSIIAPNVQNPPSA